MDYDDYDYGYEQGSADMENAADRYIDQLEKMYTKDTAELRKQLADVTAERDQLKQQLAIAQGNASAMTEKAEAAQRQLRHV